MSGIIGDERLVGGGRNGAGVRLGAGVDSTILGGSCLEDGLVLAGGTNVGELLLRAFESSDGPVDVLSDAPKRSTPSRTTLFRESCILDRALVSISVLPRRCARKSEIVLDGFWVAQPVIC